MRAIVMALLCSMFAVAQEAAAAGQGASDQAPPGPGAAAGATQGAESQPPSPAIRLPGEPYTYSSEGRRDPFLNLLGTGGEPRASGPKKTDGPATMAVADISVRGILQSRGGLVAMVQGPDNRTYIVHQGDKFLDGTIKSITPQSLVILQQINDPLSTAKQREVRKLLHTLEDVKE